MAEAIISAISAITVGLLSLLGVLAAGRKSSRDMQRQIDVAQAVTDTKIEELTREVRELNDTAKSVPAVRERLHSLDRRVAELERSEGRFMIQ